MYCHILHVRAIPTLESTDSMINAVQKFMQLEDVLSISASFHVETM